MALHPGADIEESTPLIASATDSYVDVSIEQVEEPDDGKVPMFILFGPKLKLKRIVSMYYLMFIFVLFRVSFNNGGVLMLQNLKFFFSYYNSSFDHNHPDSDYGLSSLLYAVPGCISLFFAILSDYTKYQRSYLLIYSFRLASFSAFLVTICAFISNEDHSSGHLIPENTGALNLTILQIISVLAVVSYVLGYAMFIPMPLTFGLDLLQGTKWEVLYLYFPFVYFCNNIGIWESYLLYLDFPCRRNNVVALAMAVSAWILFIIGRNMNLFPYFTPKVKLDLTISQGIKIFYSALKKRFETKSPRGHWFIQLASNMFYGDFPHHQVQMVSAFFKAHFTLIILLGILAGYQVLETLFPQQSKFLSWPKQISKKYPEPPNSNCSDYPSMSSLIFVNSFGVITMIPVFEIFFCSLIFYTDPKALPKYFRYIKSTKIKSAYETVRDRLLNYFLLIDTIPKKIFWGLFFGLASIICGLLVDVARILAYRKNTDNITCNSNMNGICTNYTVSVFSQIPQYYLSGGLEVLVIIGCQQYIYFQCYTAFQDTLKGFFLGLFYFYSCLGIVISNITYLILDMMSTTYDICIIYTENCRNNIPQNTWIIWLISIAVYLVIIVSFGIYSHYNHYQIIFKKEKIINDIVAIHKEEG